MTQEQERRLRAAVNDLISAKIDIHEHQRLLNDAVTRESAAREAYNELLAAMRQA